MASTHERNIGHLNFNGDAPLPLTMTDTLSLSQPGHTWYLYRTRMWLEFRIAAYSQTDSDEPPGEWWDNIGCFAGLQYFLGSDARVTSDEPIGGVDSLNWVQWEMLPGEVESVIITPAGFHRWTYVYRLANRISESFAKRTPSDGEEPTFWLAWNFRDPDEFINRTHVTYDVVYDLQVNWAVDSFWAPVAGAM